MSDRSSSPLPYPISSARAHSVNADGGGESAAGLSESSAGPDLRTYASFESLQREWRELGFELEPGSAASMRVLPPPDYESATRNEGLALRR